MITKPTQRTVYDEINYGYEKSTYSLQNMDSYICVVVLAAMVCISHGAGLSPYMQPIWLVIAMILISRAMPGVGGNNMNVLMLAFLILLGWLTIPEVYRILIRLVTVTFSPVDQPIVQTASIPLYIYVSEIKYYPLR